MGRRKLEKGGRRDLDAPTSGVMEEKGARERCREGGSY